jgi:hypothetical protein
MGVMAGAAVIGEAGSRWLVARSRSRTSYQFAEKVGLGEKNFPQGLKPGLVAGDFGTAESRAPSRQCFSAICYGARFCAGCA